MKNYGTSRGHSGFAPENLTTLPHLSISSATSFPKSAGEPGMTVPPISARRALTAAWSKPAFISVLSLSRMWLGVFLGAAMLYHTIASPPGKKSPTVGRSGIAALAQDRDAQLIGCDVCHTYKILCRPLPRPNRKKH